MTHKDKLLSQLCIRRPVGRFTVILILLLDRSFAVSFFRSFGDRAPAYFFNCPICGSWEIVLLLSSSFHTIITSRIIIVVLSNSSGYISVLVNHCLSTYFDVSFPSNCGVSGLILLPNALVARPIRRLRPYWLPCLKTCRLVDKKKRYNRTYSRTFRYRIKPPLGGTRIASLYVLSARYENLINLSTKSNIMHSEKVLHLKIVAGCLIEKLFTDWKK